jgi:hypothetical protein
MTRKVHNVTIIGEYAGGVYVDLKILQSQSKKIEKEKQPDEEQSKLSQ